MEEVGVPLYIPLSHSRTAHGTSYYSTQLHVTWVWSLRFFPPHPSLIGFQALDLGGLSPLLAEERHLE